MNENLIRASLVAGGVVIGAGSAYLITKRKLEGKYAAIAYDEIQDVKEYYARRYKEGAFATPESALETLVPESELGEKKPSARKLVEDILAREGYDLETTTLEIDGVEVVEERTTNIFVAAKDDPSLDEEGVPWDLGLPERQPEFPYIIHISEFMESSNDQVTLTYYEADDTLVDEREHQVPDVEGLVGQDHMGMFGRGSQDENVIYIRNEVIKTDFEVVRSEASYAEAVLGMTADELEEPAPKKRKPKRDEQRDD